MKKTQKEQNVKQMKKLLSEADAIFIGENKGLNASDLAELRQTLKKTNDRLFVVKNRLFRLATHKTDYEELGQTLRGPMMVTLSFDNPVETAKTIVEFTNQNNQLVIVSGGMQTTVFNPSDVVALSKLPDIHTLRGHLVGLIQGAAQKLVYIIQSPMGQVARVLQQRSASNGGK